MVPDWKEGLFPQLLQASIDTCSARLVNQPFAIILCKQVLVYNITNALITLLGKRVLTSMLRQDNVLYTHSIALNAVYVTSRSEILDQAYDHLSTSLEVGRSSAQFIPR